MNRDIDFIVNRSVKGIELRPNNNLSDEEKAQIVALGFRWHRAKRCFYTADSEKVRAGLRAIFGSEIEFLSDIIYSTRQDILLDIKHTIDLYGEYIPTSVMMELYEQHTKGIPRQAAQSHTANRREINAINQVLNNVMTLCKPQAEEKERRYLQ